jgi:hypothetical protein
MHETFGTTMPTAPHVWPWFIVFDCYIAWHTWFVDNACTTAKTSNTTRTRTTTGSTTTTATPKTCHVVHRTRSEVERKKLN